MVVVGSKSRPRSQPNRDFVRVTLGSLIERLDAGVSVNAEDRPAKNGEFGVLKVSAVTSGLFLPEENKTLLPGEIARARQNPRAGHIIISRANTLDLVGASALVLEDHPKLFLSDKLWQVIVRDSNRVESLWLSHVLAAPSTRAMISARATGTGAGMKNISKEALLGIEIDLPPFETQKEIVRVLSAWDRAIEQTGRLIVAKRRRKQIFVQQLLTGKRRFKEFVKTSDIRGTKFGGVPADWRYLKVGDFASEVLERNVDGADIPVLSCTKYDGLVESLTYFGKRVFSENTTNYKVVRRNQFAYPCNHVEEGSIGILNFLDAGIVSPIYAVFQTDTRVHVPFLYALFKTPLYRHIFEISTSASVDRRGSLRWSQFAQIKVALPTVKEQKKIAECLFCCDREIRNLCLELGALKEQKMGLMQKLLTGKTRVTST